MKKLAVHIVSNFYEGICVCVFGEEVQSGKHIDRVNVS